MKTITPRGFLRYHLFDALAPQNAPALSPVERYKIVTEAKRLRNFWFTSSILSRTSQTSVYNIFANNQAVVARSQTPRFSEPVIVTDALSMFELPLDKQTASLNGPVSASPILLTSIRQYGGNGNALGRDFYDSAVPIISWLTVKHERNRRNVQVSSIPGVNIPDLADKDLPFVPYMLKPYEFFDVLYYQDLFYYNDVILTNTPIPHLGFRGFRVLPDDSPYAKLTKLADTRVRDYINTSEPDTFLMQITFPLSDLGAISTGFVEKLTPQQDRPILILGAASNVEGCQFRLREDQSYYRFTYQDAPAPAQFPSGGAYSDPPLQLMAPNTDFRNTHYFNMWPVPHVLEPGAQLKLRLNNGCLPDITGVLLQQAATRSSQDVRITFLCRTP